MPRTKFPANVVGTEVRRQRNAIGLTQEAFAGRCQLQGLDISRATVAQIEARLRCVTDSELFQLSRVFDVSVDSLYPTEMKKTRKRRKRFESRAG